MTKRKSSWARGYDGRWRAYRLSFLAKNPLCVMCKDQGIITAATVVDHKKPHRDDNKLFWDTNNHQPLCKLHHDSTKQREEKGGYAGGYDKDGWPIG